LNPIDIFLTVHHGRTRQELASALPNANDVLHEDADGFTVADPLSLMSVMHKRPSQRPHVLLAEFDRHGQVEFSELRRTFSNARDAQMWMERAQDRLTEELSIQTRMPLERPIMRTTAHDGRLIFWRSWVVNDASVLTMACRRLGGRGAVATLAMAFEPWHPTFGPFPQMASYPHRADEWAGWERLTREWPAVHDQPAARFDTRDHQDLTSHTYN